MEVKCSRYSPQVEVIDGNAVISTPPLDQAEAKALAKKFSDAAKWLNPPTETGGADLKLPWTIGVDHLGQWDNPVFNRDGGMVACFEIAEEAEAVCREMNKLEETA